MIGITPKVLIIAANAKVKQKIYENLLPLEYKITKLDKLAAVKKSEYYKNYNLVIVVTNNEKSISRLNHISSKYNNTEFLILTPHIYNDMQHVHQYLSTGFQEVDIILTANKVLKKFNKLAKIHKIKEQIDTKRKVRDYFTPITANTFIEKQLEMVRNYAVKGENIFISGEKGTGKSRIVDYIYHLNMLENKNYLYIDCENFSEKKIHYILFDSPGSGKYYTDYLNPKFKGILYLDHISKLSLEMQSKLVDRLKQVFSRLVDPRSIQVITTSRLKPKDALEDFLLLPSLCKMLCNHKIQLTPLKERKEDIIPLFNHFQKITIKEHDLKEKPLTENFKYLLKAYDWPVNIDQLKDVAQKYCFFGDNISEKEFSRLIETTEEEQLQAYPLLTHKSKQMPNTPQFLRRNLK